eukprot:gene7841-1042_t
MCMYEAGETRARHWPVAFRNSTLASLRHNSSCCTLLTVALSQYLSAYQSSRTEAWIPSPGGGPPRAVPHTSPGCTLLTVELSLYPAAYQSGRYRPPASFSKSPSTANPDPSRTEAWIPSLGGGPPRAVPHTAPGCTLLTVELSLYLSAYQSSRYRPPASSSKSPSTATPHPSRTEAWIPSPGGGPQRAVPNTALGCTLLTVEVGGSASLSDTNPSPTDCLPLGAAISVGVDFEPADVSPLGTAFAGVEFDSADISSLAFGFSFVGVDFESVDFSPLGTAFVGVDFDSADLSPLGTAFVGVDFDPADTSCFEVPEAAADFGPVDFSPLGTSFVGVDFDPGDISSLACGFSIVGVAFDPADFPPLGTAFVGVTSDPADISCLEVPKAAAGFGAVDIPPRVLPFARVAFVPADVSVPSACTVLGAVGFEGPRPYTQVALLSVRV